MRCENSQDSPNREHVIYPDFDNVLTICRVERLVGCQNAARAEGVIGIENIVRLKPDVVVFDFKTPVVVEGVLPAPTQHQTSFPLLVGKGASRSTARKIVVRLYIVKATPGYADLAVEQAAIHCIAKAQCQSRIPAIFCF